MPGHPAVAVRSASDKVAGMAELDIETAQVGLQPRILDGDQVSGSAARTNDLEADEDPPHTRSARDRGEIVVVQVICCLQ